MSIFGKLDAATISTNPFWVEEGEYTAEITDGKYQFSKRKNVRQLVIEYTIDDDSSQYVDSKVAHFFDLVDSEMTAEDFELLPNEEKKAIRRSNAALKRTLCGTDKGEGGLGIDPNDLNDPDWDPASLRGLKVDIGVNNFGPKNEGVSVKWVRLRED